VQTACAQACPTSAIVFGNANDQTSSVSLIRTENPQRLFYVLEQIHTLPNVSYLAKIRNSQEIVGGGDAEHGSEQAAQSTTEPVPAQHAPAKEGGH
jgi:molybdopterin-containing oxidoreductase family iron-sulfur binding subunit